ncbi:MAG TPA: sugar transferase [Longimicrobiales bacterium]|nr:sugar transferase [Longimicrobiales bacterium]
MSTHLLESVAVSEQVRLPRATGELRSNPAWAYSRAKRALDLFISVMALVVTFPLAVLIALVIRLDSPGPVFFSQQRVGENRRRRNVGYGGPERRRHDYGGKPFQILKFRTMRTGVEPYAWSPHHVADPRLTTVGSALRSACLDELPQLINVIRGDMSVVGPRPEMPFIVATYPDEAKCRLDVRPGITGPWQIRGSRTRPIHEALHLDLEYLEVQSFRADLRIVAETLVFMVRRLNV